MSPETGRTERGGWPSGEAGREGKSLGVLGAVQRPGGCRQGVRDAGPR